MALQDYYNDTDDVDDHEFFDDDTYFAQTFVANQDYTITSVKLLIGWYVSYEPGTNVIVSIRATTDYLGIPALGRIPTGDDLCSKSIACSSLPEYPDLISPPKTWTEITFDTPLALISGTEYAIVLRTDHPLSDIVWQKDASDSYYTFGNYAFYNGIFWTSILTDDFLFETYDSNVFSPPVSGPEITQVKRLVAAAADAIWYESI